MASARSLPPVALTAVLLAPPVGCGFNFKFYHPDRDDDPIAWEGIAFEEGFVDGPRKRKVHFVYAVPVGPPKATVFVVPGDGGNLASSADMVRPFVDNEFAVFAFDYPGYGQSEGRPTHRSVLAAANAALTHMLAIPGVRGTKVLVAGFSLGGQIAIVLTAQRQHEVDALLVEATYTSHDDIAEHTSRASGLARLFVRAPYSAEEAIRTLTIPKLIVHSRDDRTIPYAMGQDLYRLAPEPKQLWTVDGKHAQAFELHAAEYVRRVEALLGLTSRSRSKPSPA